MIIIIPIGGFGKRFQENGYKRPKALINVHGRSMISKLLDNLNTDKVDYVFIPYNKEYKKYRFEDLLTNQYPGINFKFFCLENNTRGAAETINIGIRILNEVKDIPVLCLDCDSFYTCDIVSQWSGKNCVFTFETHNESPIYSYAKVNQDDEIFRIKEKVKISNHACCAYGFSSMNQLKKYTSKIIEQNITQQLEFYMSGVIQLMIDDGHTFKNEQILESDFICLGTPSQLKLFCNNYSNDKHIMKNKRICFDLDNTLVTFPKLKSDYTSVQPIEKNIELLKYLKAAGNTIIIYTARKMKTHGGNIGKLNADIGKITFETLESFDIPYDEIYFGKPHADFYIDDLAVSCFDNLEKELGYYNNKIEPRDFHSIHNGSIATIMKTGELEGEYYYYENIPRSIKDLFPIFISGNNTIIIIEQIQGLTVTDLYLSEILNEKTFIYILDSINRIHNCETSTNTCDIYANYSAKLMQRYNQFDYTVFENSEIMYKTILSSLQHYETHNLGKSTVIHGDPVFTNIIINHYGNTKFIDMRGRVGDQLTIFGDWLYDWAKIYQSLIGYDEILLSKVIDSNYKNRMIDTFKQYFVEHFSEQDFAHLQMISRSLIFSLIPLHNNEKCTQYYNLLFSEYLK